MSTAVRSRARFIKLFAVLATLFVAAAPQGASAQIVTASDCSFGFKNVYLDNEPVCAFGNAQGSFLGASGLACVLPAGGGGPGDDVTPGGCNAVAAAGLFEEFLWLPPTVPGNYIIALFNNQGGVATDVISINSSGGAPPTVDVAAIKGEATVAANTWHATELFAQNLDDFYSAYSIGMAAATGDFVGAAVNIAGAALGVPTSYNDWVVQQGGAIMAALAGQQRARFESLAADPPDPVYTELFPLDLAAVNADLATYAPLLPGAPLQYPFANQSQDPLHLANVRFANSIVEQTALVFAFMRTLEKLQGAEAATDDQFILLQASGLIQYADQLTAQLATTRQGALDYKAELTAAGLADIVYDSADINAFNARLVASGLTAAEEQSLRDVGFTDTDLQVILDRANAYVPASGTYSRGGGLDDIIASIDSMLPVIADLRADAQAVVDFYAPLVTVQHPTADAGGPYIENEGTAVLFDASASSDPQAQALTIEWDFDLDGVFDDAVGATTSNTYNAPVVTKVGVRVTDTDGNTDIAYADVTILEVNGPPEITSFIPADLSPTASDLSPLDFSATATDPDADALNFEWSLDGAVTSNADSWTYTPGIGETGTRSVRLTVSDLNPLSEDAIQTRLVVLVEEVLVPDVVGLAQAAAEAAIVADGLVVGNVDTDNSDTVPAGNVISQNPVDGTIALLGSAVDIVVSLGPVNVVVPDVVGLPQAAAEAAIVAANLTIGTITTANSDTVPAGDVISQNPAGGASVAPGSAVDLAVSLGPADVSVPDVVGLAQGAAEAAIVAANLTIGTITTANNDTVPAGDVISQNPAGGASVAPGSAVNLTVSLGPADVSVPDVVGLPQAAAEAAIVAANLTIGTITTANSDTVPAGNVISQNPAGGASVAPGSAVALVVSDGPEGEPPTAPENLQGRAKGLHVNLGWQGSDTATSFLVFRRLDSETDFTQVGQVVPRAFVDDMPAGTTSAEYFVVARNDFGDSSASRTVTVLPTSRRR